MQNTLKAAVLAALMLSPAVSFADEAESNFSWNAAVVTDYVFRGVSQTDRSFALQAGVDYAMGDSGFYAGAWASNVDYGNSYANLEVDTYIGFNKDLGESVNLDVMFVRYNYFGAESCCDNIDYNELIAKLDVKNIATLTLGYAKDYGNTNGLDATYINISRSWEVGKDFTLNAGFGRTNYNTGGDINDWTVGLSKTFGKFEIGLSYFDTNQSYRLSDTVVLSVKVGG